MSWLTNFVIESNRIEGISGAKNHEIEAHGKFLCSGATVSDIEEFVTSIAPGHVLRDTVGLNVRVGDYIAPQGGPIIREQFEELLKKVKKGYPNPWAIHVEYEHLHPFTDGNGRSGRALWLWVMQRIGGVDYTRAMQLGFLHTFYYQTLENDRS